MYISSGTGAVDTGAHVAARITGANDIDFVAHVGDLSYGEGNTAVWETFMCAWNVGRGVRGRGDLGAAAARVLRARHQLAQSTCLPARTDPCSAD